MAYEVTKLLAKDAEYRKVYDGLVDRNIDELMKGKDALKNHFKHLVVVLNNQVWVIHLYKEFAHSINQELYNQCIPRLNKVVDVYNNRLVEARRLCKVMEPESFMKTSLLKITHIKKGEPDGSVR